MKKNLNKKRITNLKKNIPIKLPKEKYKKSNQISNANQKIYINKNQYGSQITKSKIQDYHNPYEENFTSEINKKLSNCCNNECNGCCECEWYPNIENDISDNGICKSSTNYNGYCNHTYHCNGNVSECDDMCSVYNGHRQDCISSSVECCDINKNIIPEVSKKNKWKNQSDASFIKIKRHPSRPNHYMMTNTYIINSAGYKNNIENLQFNNTRNRELEYDCEFNQFYWNDALKELASKYEKVGQALDYLEENYYDANRDSWNWEELVLHGIIAGAVGDWYNNLTCDIDCLQGHIEDWANDLITNIGTGNQQNCLECGWPSDYLGVCLGGACLTTEMEFNWNWSSGITGYLDESGFGIGGSVYDGQGEWNLNLGNMWNSGAVNVEFNLSFDLGETLPDNTDLDLDNFQWPCDQDEYCSNGNGDRTLCQQLGDYAGLNGCCTLRYSRCVWNYECEKNCAEIPWHECELFGCIWDEKPDGTFHCTEWNCGIYDIKEECEEGGGHLGCEWNGVECITSCSSISEPEICYDRGCRWLVESNICVNECEDISNELDCNNSPGCLWPEMDGPCVEDACYGLTIAQCNTGDIGEENNCYWDYINNTCHMGQDDIVGCWVINEVNPSQPGDWFVSDINHCTECCEIAQYGHYNCDQFYMSENWEELCYPVENPLMYFVWDYYNEYVECVERFERVRLDDCGMCGGLGKGEFYYNWEEPLDWQPNNYSEEGAAGWGCNYIADSGCAHDGQGGCHCPIEEEWSEDDLLIPCCCDEKANDASVMFDESSCDCCGKKVPKNFCQSYQTNTCNSQLADNQCKYNSTTCCNSNPETCGGCDSPAYSCDPPPAGHVLCGDGSITETTGCTPPCASGFVSGVIGGDIGGIPELGEHNTAIVQMECLGCNQTLDCCGRAQDSGGFASGIACDGICTSDANLTAFQTTNEYGQGSCIEEFQQESTECGCAPECPNSQGSFGGHMCYNQSCPSNISTQTVECDSPCEDVAWEGDYDGDGDIDITFSWSCAESGCGMAGFSCNCYQVIDQGDQIMLQTPDGCCCSNTSFTNNPGPIDGVNPDMINSNNQNGEMWFCDGHATSSSGCLSNGMGCNCPNLPSSCDGNG